MSGNSLKKAGGKALRMFKRFGDLEFVIALIVAAGSGVLLFYTYIYPPIYAPQEPLPKQAIFNKNSYQRVIDNFAGREKNLNDQINKIPQNPFQR